MAKPSTINISMPPTLSEFVKLRMAQKGFDNTSEYFRYLVREDLKRAKEDHLETLLLEGLNSGKPIPINDEWWEDRRRELVRRLKKRKTA